MNRRGFEMLGLLTQVGIGIVITLGLAALAGSFLDGRLHTSPYLTLLGVVVGVIAAYLNTVKLIGSFFTDDSREEEGPR